MSAFVAPGTGLVFISYRRDDTAFLAGWLYDRLAEHFGGARVFKDVDSIELGDDFADAITAAVGSCAVLLAVIGAKWLTVTDTSGRRRLDDPEDFVRLEIEAALARKVRVIPVVAEGARMPSGDELPASLRELARRQALELRPSRFHSDTRHLLNVLDGIVVGTPGRRPLAEGAGPADPPSRRPAWLMNRTRNRIVIAAALATAAGAGIIYVASSPGRSASPGRSTRGSGSTSSASQAVRVAAPGTPIPVGKNPDWIAITPDGKTAYVTNDADGTVTPIHLATGKPGAPFSVGSRPSGIAITPDGKAAYVTNYGDGTVTPVSLVTGRPGRPIRVGNHPFRIAITPDGKTAYVTNQADGTVTPVNLAAGTAGHPIFVGHAPQMIVITTDGKTAYVANQSTNTITPISLPANVPGPPIKVGYYPDGITISPDGKTAYTTDNGLGTITPVDLATGQDGTMIVISSPIGIAITRDGKTGYVADYAAGTVTPVSLPSGAPGTPVKVGNHPDAIVIAPDGKTAYVTNNGDGTVTPITLPAGQTRPRPSGGPSHPVTRRTAPASSPATSKSGFPGSVTLPMDAACQWAYPGKATGQTSGSIGSIHCLAPNGKDLGGFIGTHSLAAWCQDPRHTDGRHMSNAWIVSGVWVCIP